MKITEKWVPSMYRLLLLIALFSLFGCKPSDKKDVLAGESLIKATLRHPDSARLTSFYKPSGDNDGYVCGKVNAQDDNGVYSGSRSYYVYIEMVDGVLRNHSPAIMVEPGDVREMMRYQLFCQ